MARHAIPSSDQGCFDFAQLSVPSPRRKSGPSDNLYLALKPLPDDADRIAGVAATWLPWLGPRSIQMSPGCLHISLVSCNRHDGLPASLVGKVCDLMKGFEGYPIEVTFDLLGRFGGDSVVLYSETTNHALQALRRALLARLTAIPVVRLTNGKAFEPHMTVFHDERRVPTKHVDAVGWRACEVTLVHSRAGLHAILERWPLVGSTIDPAYGQTQDDGRLDLFG